MDEGMSVEAFLDLCARWEANAPLDLPEGCLDDPDILTALAHADYDGFCEALQSLTVSSPPNLRSNSGVFTFPSPSTNDIPPFAQTDFSCHLPFSLSALQTARDNPTLFLSAIDTETRQLFKVQLSLEKIDELLAHPIGRDYTILSLPWRDLEEAGQISSHWEGVKEAAVKTAFASKGVLLIDTGITLPHPDMEKALKSMGVGFALVEGATVLLMLAAVAKGVGGASAGIALERQQMRQRESAASNRLYPPVRIETVEVVPNVFVPRQPSSALAPARTTVTPRRGVPAGGYTKAIGEKKLEIERRRVALSGRGSVEGEWTDPPSAEMPGAREEGAGIGAVRGPQESEIRAIEIENLFSRVRQNDPYFDTSRTNPYSGELLDTIEAKIRYAEAFLGTDLYRSQKMESLAEALHRARSLDTKRLAELV